MHSNLSGLTKAVCYSEVFAIRGNYYEVSTVLYSVTVHNWLATTLEISMYMEQVQQAGSDLV